SDAEHGPCISERRPREAVPPVDEKHAVFVPSRPDPALNYCKVFRRVSEAGPEPEGTLVGQYRRSRMVEAEVRVAKLVLHDRVRTVLPQRLLIVKDGAVVLLVDVSAVAQLYLPAGV